MLLPPKSTRKALRLGNASTITQISHIYGILISSWLLAVESSEDGGAKDDDSTSDDNNTEKAGDGITKKSIEPWAPAFRAKLIATAGSLQVMRTQVASAKFEG